MKLLQINSVLNSGSTGRITEEIGRTAVEAGHESFVGYSKMGPAGTISTGIKIGSEPDRYLHGLKTRLLDLHGFGSEKATKQFVSVINEIDPDIIGLHNLHGYYLNIEVLFNYLKKMQKPVVWTFHDCWPFTGHCTYFDSVGCEKWIDGCHNCPKKKMYPASYGLDNSKWNYAKKRELFNGLEQLTIVTPSRWLAELTRKSFLKDYPVQVIHNGIDTELFSPGRGRVPGALDENDRKIVLGVASTWDARKGLDEFIKLQNVLDDEFRIVLVGLNKKQLRGLPAGITGIARTENAEQLAALYSAANVFVNPTWQDNFPTTNIEALACGTPVITYNTGGSPEAIDDETGAVVDQGDINGLKKSILKISKKEKSYYQQKCRQRALNFFNKEDRFRDYLNIYEKIIL